MSDASVADNIQSRAGLSHIQKLDSFSLDFMAVPYQNDPLGEGGGIDSDPVYRFDAFDCVTYVETVMALSHAKDFDDFMFQKKNLSYKNGILDYEHRKHFFEADHADTLIDITTNLGVRTKTINAIIDRQKFMETKKDALNLVYAPENITLSYIPTLDTIRIDTEKLPKVSLVGIVQNNPKIRQNLGSDVLLSHVGFLINNDGHLLFRHASSATGNVTEQDFKSYISGMKDSKTRIGIKIWRIK